MIQGLVRVHRRLYDDSGIACVAMVAGISYERAMEALGMSGSAKQPVTQSSCHSSLEKLGKALAAAGVATRTRRFKTWSDLGALSIVKSRVFRNQKLHRDWHWVAAVRRGPSLPSGMASIEILDPGSPTPCFELAPANLECVDFGLCKPFGNYIEVVVKSR